MTGPRSSVLLRAAFACAAAALVAGVLTETAHAAQSPPKPGPLDPRGKIHIPIGIANTVDTLKTFVEAEGCFSPGFATYGVYFWLYDPAAGKLVAPTMDVVKCEHGFASAGSGRGQSHFRSDENRDSPRLVLIPWTTWQAAGVTVKTEVCHVRRASPAGDVHVAGARVQLWNDGRADRKVSLFVALRPLGPAGGPVRRLAVSDDGTALLVDGHPAIVSDQKATAAGVANTDRVGALAMEGKLPGDKKAESPSGDCSGALRFDLTVGAADSVSLGFVCPVLPGRRAVGHQWDGTSKWAQLDLAEPNPAEGGAPQPDPGLEYYRGLKVNTLFDEAAAYWRDLVGRATLNLPDRRWNECFAAIVGHAALAMNEGAPDVAVVNYNVFNRDGVYVANILQKAGRPDLAAAAIDYFLAHPFNGRVQCEADNPGQVLWIVGQHWLFTRDREWLARAYPSAAKLAAMIRYYRTAPPPHYVKAASLEFGDRLPPDGPDDKPADRRQVLKPGSCDGHHPEYTEAFDIAGLRAAAVLAKAAGKEDDAAAWEKLAAALFASYDKQFGANLSKGYGSYSVLWPCRLYPLAGGRAFEQFEKTGAQRPTGWRYFPLATAHQGLLTGNRAAGHGTLAAHLDHEQMRGWYAFDEGGASGPGGWRFARTTWKPGVAMPHGWAIAEVFLLLRDSLLFEDGDRVVLLGGVPEEWFRAKSAWGFQNLPTWFGPCSVSYAPDEGGAVLSLTGKAAPPGGFVLRLPRSLSSRVTMEGKPVAPTSNGNVLLPPGTRRVNIRWNE